MLPNASPKKLRSNTARLAGLVAYWGERLTFRDLASRTSEIQLQVRAKNDVVGKASLLVALPTSPQDEDLEYEESFTLALKPQGEIRIHVSFHAGRPLFGSSLTAVRAGPQGARFTQGA